MIPMSYGQIDIYGESIRVPFLPVRRHKASNKSNRTKSFSISIISHFVPRSATDI